MDPSALVRTRRHRSFVRAGRHRLAPVVLAATLVVLASGCLMDGTWSATTLAATTPPTFPGSAYSLTDVACVGQIWCLAVGRGEGPIAQEWDGSAWTNVTLPTADGIENVDCGAPDRCGAIVDRFPDDPGNYRYYVVWDGSQWIDVPTGGAIDGPAATPYACASDGCVFIDTALRSQMIVWDGSSFTVLPFFDPFGEPEGMDCQSIDDCLAGTGFSTGHWDGSSWTELVGATNPDDLGVVSVGPFSCGTSTTCVGAGSTATGTVFVHWDGTDWYLEEIPVATSSSPSISCSSAHACFAVTRGQFPQSVTWNGHDWFTMPTMPGSLAVRYNNISCVPLTCIAVGFEPAPNAEPVASLYEYTNP